jgi:hypothetical protein
MMIQTNAHMRRKIKTFWAKWGGLIIATAIVVPLSILGGNAIYDNGLVDTTLTWVTQDIILVPPGIAFSTIQEDPPRSVYHLELQVNNQTTTSANVVISDVSTALDEFKLTVTPTNSWQETIGPGGRAIFEGNITFTPDIVSQLTQRGMANVVVSGVIQVSAKYGWLQKNVKRPINISTTILLPKT